MNDNIKTAIFSAAALVLCVAAWAASIRPAPNNPEEVGKSLFAEFKDPLDAKKMSIVSYDDKARDYRTFEVKQEDGLWTLTSPPNRAGYPADAKTQVTDASNALIGVKVLGKVSSDTSTFVDYGVVEPQPGKEDASTKGMGKLIEIDDAKGKPLAALIVGKEDKPRTDNGPGAGASLHFVRRPGSNDVLRVSLNVDKFSTKFDDWIEKDLLKLKPFDVTEIDLKDYSVDKKITQGGAYLSLDKRLSAKLAFNDKDSKWSLVEMVDDKPVDEAPAGKGDAEKPAPGKDGDAKEPADKEKDAKGKKEPAGDENDKNQAAADPLAADAEKVKVITKLPEGDVLNESKLNDLKSALADLKIVDVQRKSPGMIAYLKGEKQGITKADVQSLQSHGFYLVQGDLYSDQGEVQVQVKDGVRYELRFGETAEQTAEQQDAKDGKKDDKKKDDKDGDDKKTPGVNRYLYVKVDFNKDAIPAPTLLDLPAEPKPDAGKADDKADDKKDDKQNAKDKTPADAGDKKPDDAKKPDDKKADDKKAGDKPADPNENDKNYQPPKKDGAADKAADKSKPADKAADKADKSADKAAAAKADVKEAAKQGEEKPADKKEDAKQEGEKKEGDKSDDKKSADDKKEGEKTEAPVKPARPEANPDNIARNRKFIEMQNKRLQDEYDEKVKAGERHAAELNVRFADWYYVVPDDVFRKIHLGRADIIKKKGEKLPDDGDAETGPPGGFKIPDSLKPGVLPKNPHK